MGQSLDTFQLDTLKFLDRAHGRAVVADPMGARKTATTLTWLDETFAKCNYERALVVAPSSVHGHWAREAGRFTLFTVLHGTGTKSQRTKALELAAQPLFDEGRPKLYITTYESMKQDQHALKLAKFDAIVFDEGHKLKGRRTQVALCANDLVKGPAHCIIVTGTPVLNHAAELWQYLHMLLPSQYPAYWRWVEEHYVVESKNFRGNRFPTRIIHGFRPGHDEIVRNQIDTLFIQRDIAELFPNQAWVEEPEHVEIEVELTSAERKAYDSLVKHKWGLVGGKEVTTRNSLDLTTRLTQITSDWGTLEEGVEHGSKTKATIELTLDLLERDEPVLIFAKYKATVYRIVAALNKHGQQARAFTGDQDPKTKEIALADFSNDGGGTKVLVGTLDSMSEGVDGLQHQCSNVILVDRHWTPAKNDQAIGRLRRSGQIKRVTVWHVFAADTIDETITAACLRKTNVIELLRGVPLTEAIYGRI